MDYGTDNANVIHWQCLRLGMCVDLVNDHVNWQGPQFGYAGQAS